MNDEIRRWLNRHRLSTEAQAELEALLGERSPPVEYGTSRMGPLVAPPRAESQPAPPPTDRYTFVALLGKGGQGEVWRVFDRVLDRPVAMKLLPASADPERMHAFFDEARFTGKIAHPGVVPVHDLGQLPDGRWYFTSQEVEGQTLALRLRTDPLRRLLELLLRVAEAVAAAHARGVVHRDLKPANIMVGEHGEVLVLDWGLVARAGEALESAAGTAAYMAPEQARGAVPDPRADVYALGQLLAEILTGEAPFAGIPQADVRARLQRGELPAPPRPADPLLGALGELCAASLALDPEARPADAGVFATALRAWLDGEARRAQAEARLAEVPPLQASVAALRAQASAEAEAADVALRRLNPLAPVSEKEPLWMAQDRAKELEKLATVAEVDALRALHAARAFAPELPVVDEALADLYRAQLDAADRRGDRESAALADALLSVHDHSGRHRAWREGRGALCLETDPPGAMATLYRFVERGRRLVPEPMGALGPTPLREIPISPGSYLVELEAPGRVPVRYPVCIGRGERWDGVPPGEDRPMVIPLPPVGALGEEDVYVPAGWAWTGDPEAQGGLPRQKVWVDAFAIRRCHITNAEYLAFLNDLVATGQEEEALRCAPRMDERAGADSRCYERDAGGFFLLGRDAQGDAWLPRWPVLCLDEESVQRFVRWVSAREGRSWRLPYAMELEKAARGVDGRIYPWGDYPEPTWTTCSKLRREGHNLPDAVDAPPEDVSVYGVHGVAGGARDRCADAFPPTEPALSVEGRAICPDPPVASRPDQLSCYVGGSWSNPMQQCRSASRWLSKQTARAMVVSFRLARAYSQGSS